MATLRATSNCTGDRDNLGQDRYSLQDGDATVAYVYAKSGDAIYKSFFPAHRSTGVSIYYERSVAVEVSNGNLQLGLGLADLNKSNWHTIQIVSLIKYDSFDQLVGPLKAPLKAKLDEANSYITHSDDNPERTAKKAFQTVINTAQDLYDSKTSYSEVVAGAADFEQAIADLEAAYEVYALSGTIPHPNYPFDVTFKIVNPTFGNNNANGWTYNEAPGFQTYGNAEYFMKNFDINQTITGMPQAKYLLKVKAFQRPGDAAVVIPAYIGAEDNADGTFGVTAEIYVNNASQKIKNAASAMRTSALNKGGGESEVSGYYIPNDMNSADKYFISDYYENEAEMICTTGTLKFGFRCSDGTGSKYWTIFDDFRLYMTDAIDLSVYQNELALAVNKATEQASRNVPQAVKDAINAVITEYNKEWSTIDEYVTAIEAVNNSYANYDMDALESAYQAATSYQFTSKYYNDVYALSQVEYEEIIEGANAELLAAISSNTILSPDPEVYNAKTSAGDINDYITGINTANLTADENLKAAGIAYVAKANPTTGNQFDLTFMLTNPNLEGLPIRKGCDGWYTDREGGNSQVMTNDAVTSEDGTNKTAFYEYWSDAPAADDNFTLYQKVTLPAGIYNMSCYAFAQQPTGGDVRGVKFYANDTEGSTVVSAKLAPASIEFVNTTSGEVKVGLKGCAGNTYRWMGIGYVHLYKLNNVKTATLADTDTKAPAAGAYTSITYERTLKKGLNTLVLPFQTTKDEIGASKVLQFEGAEKEDENSTKVVLEFSVTENLSPNTPYVVITEDEVTLPIFKNKTVVEPTNLTVNGVEFSFVGTYKDGTDFVEAGDYIANASQGKFLKAAGGNRLKAYRAYLKKMTENTPVNELNVSVDGEFVDGIMAVEILREMGVENIYNLNGQKVSHTQKGVYIVNGRKVVVK